MSKSIPQIILSCCVLKTAPKSTKYSRNETILKIGHYAKVIALAKSSLWVKSENSKKYVKIHSTKHFELLGAKNRCKKTLNIREMRPFWKSAIMQRRKLLQNHPFGSKIKIPKNISKFILQIILSCCVQKTAPKNSKYSRNETIFKIGHHAKPIAFSKSSLWVKN